LGIMLHVGQLAAERTRIRLRVFLVDWLAVMGATELDHLYVASFGPGKRIIRRLVRPVELTLPRRAPPRTRTPPRHVTSG
jgi:hypothetical protein